MGKLRRTSDSGEQLQVLPPEQVFLFERYEPQPKLLVRIKEFNHTGARLLNDPERLQDVIEAMLNGASLRAVAKQFHIARETLTQAYKLLEDSGRLRPFKERLAEDWRETVSLTQWRIQEALVMGEMPLQVLPALAGIATDKLLLLTHSMPEESRQKTITLDPEALAEVVASARAQEGTVDAESSVSKRNALVVNDSVVSDTLLDMAEGVVDGGVGVENGRADDGMEGGGDRVSGARPDGRGDGSGKF